MTDAYALFGYPVAHSWSPFIHGMFARQTQQDLSYRLYESPPERFRSDVLEFFSAGGRGINVTVPHKHAAADLVNELTPRAQLADAVNTITLDGQNLVGDNTDGIGLVADLRGNLGLRWTEPRILLLGAGGAARGVIGPLLELAPARARHREPHRRSAPISWCASSRRSARCRAARSASCSRSTST